VNRRKLIFFVGLMIVMVAVLWPASRALLRPHFQRAADTSSFQSTPALAPASPTALQKANLATSRTSEMQRERTVQNILGVLATPITFYGRVIDQNGEPVARAEVDYGTIDKFDESGSKYQGKSSEDGSFSIGGIKGAVLTVGVRKEGYYNIHGKSDAAFAYGVGVDPTRKAPPTKESPALFVLQKRGPTEPLIRVGGGQIDVPRTGEPLNIDFATGKIGRGDLEIRAWVADTNERRFDWRYQLAVSGGGLIEKANQFDFEAPSDGYRPSVDLNMPATAEKWCSDVPREYFVKLPDGKYARFSIEFYAGDRNFVVFTSYLNPAVGHRNLEFDPAKQIKVK
jgi:hypothetical protein